LRTILQYCIEDVKGVCNFKNEVPVSLMMLDINNFKRINDDTYGHSTGDEVLSQFAGILKIDIRSIDIVARWGGEEFVIILPQAISENVLKLAERIRQSIVANTFNLGLITEK
jgi:diguanylate cyclase (GGDEF)-like protein